MSHTSLLSSSDIKYVVRITTRLLHDQGLECCLFGSAAGMIHGTSRCPNDVDMIALTDELDAEEIKRLLVNDDHRFYTVPSTNPRNTYEILWFDLAQRQRSSIEKTCKVDIVVPGTLGIPDIPVRLIEYDETFSMPVLPLEPLILLKLKGWHDHHLSQRPDFQEKQYDDIQDLEELVDFALQEGFAIERNTWLPDWFCRAAFRRFLDFVAVYPAVGDTWREFGIENCRR